MIYENVDKITATICRPLPDLTLKHVVKLAYKDKSGRREFFHREVVYNSSTYNNLSRLTNINLNFNSYFILEESEKDFNERDNVLINQGNIFTFRRVFRIALDWFYRVKDITVINRGDLRIRDKYSELMEEVYLSDGKIIRIRPTILNIGDTQYEGIKMLINSEMNEYLFTLDNFAMLADIIMRADLYQYGLIAISYLGRPEEGMFTFSMENSTNSYPNAPKANGTVSKGMREYMERRNTNLNNL